MARSRRGGKAAAKPKNEIKNEPKNDESFEVKEKERLMVDETYIVAGTDGLNEKISTALLTVPDVKVSIEKCDAFLVKHKANENEDSFMESESEGEEVKATAGKEGGEDYEEDLSEEESAPNKEAVNDRGSDSEEFNLQSASADESDLDESLDGEEEVTMPPPSKSKTNATFVRHPDATKKPKKAVKNEPEKASAEAVSGSSKRAPVMATGYSRNPGKVASVAEKKKLGSAATKVASEGAASGSRKTATDTKGGASKAKGGGSRKAVPEKPISDAKKDIIIDLLMDGLSKHDERKGVSMPTIKKYVVENDVKERNWSQLQSRVKKALDNALMEGKILRPKGNEHMNGMIGRFKVNKNYRTKKVSKRGGANSSELESSPKKEVTTSKPTKSSAASAKAKKRSADREEEIPPKETKGKASKVPKRRPKVFSTSDSDEEFEKPIPLKAPAVKGPRRKSKSGGEIVKATSKVHPKPKIMKRSHSVESVTTSTNTTKGRSKSKK